MRLAIGTDHAAYEVKQHLLPAIRDMGHEVDDFGCDGTESCDHADFSIPVAEAVARGEYDGAVLMCGSGQGMTIGANKVPGIRATLCFTPEQARLAREHNNSNILTMGGRIVTPDQAVEILKAWASADFQGGRHARRMSAIAEYERKRSGD